MNKLVLLLTILGLTHYCWAAFYWNHMPPKQRDLDTLGLGCIPGRTVLRMPSGSSSKNYNDDDDNDADDYKRKGTDVSSEEDGKIETLALLSSGDNCKICICSVEGKDEYCSTRPANTVNECIRLATIQAELQKGGMPFDHVRDLSQRIRRDLIWHRDEIEYDSKAKCFRGTSYYSNNPNAANTDIDVAADIDSLLNYADKTVCFYCVCSVSGTGVGCVSRSAYFCDYYRFLHRDGVSTMRDIYTNMFQQDRPSYFRSLAYRVRRTMDDGMYALILNDLIWHRDEIEYDSKAKCFRGTSYYSNNPNAANTDIDVADDIVSLLNYADKTVCFYCVCSVSGSGVGCVSRSAYFCDYYRFLHRDGVSTMRDIYTNMFQQDRPSYFRSLAYRVRRTMDDGMYALILNAGPAIDGPCVPFVSEYSDCNDDNQCTGCTRCSCSSDGSWVCNKVHECPQEQAPIDEKVLNSAFNTILYEYSTKKTVEKSGEPVQDSKNDDLVLDNTGNIEQKILELMRRKRAITKSKGKSSNHTSPKTEEDVFNGTIKFYHTVDEINEDTLKNANISGTLPAAKVDLTNLLSRRTDPLHRDNFNSSESPLQIEYSHHKNIDNKLEGNQSVYGIDLIGQEKLGIITNYTQQEKDSDLSKIIVNELNIGTEIIGDKHAPIMSNITFTPENDTLTAMAFIAGNLLNKLWSMEKDSGDESMEIEALKNEKIQDLLELFKEPLTMRQEAFLKTALETLSRAIDKNKDAKNVSLCESILDAKKFMEDSENMHWDKTDVPTLKPEAEKATETVEKDIVVRKSNDQSQKQKNATVKAIAKINSVLTLIKKYEAVNKRLNNLKRNNKDVNDPKIKSVDVSSTEIQADVDGELNMFGKILEKVTKLLLPYKGSKRISNKLKKLNVFAAKGDKAKQKFKELFNVDLGNTTLTARDKLILDYLLKMNTPRAVMDDNGSDEVPPKYIEGDILLNLSEFFKIKSFVDLIKMLDLEKGDNKALRTVLIESTTELIASTTQSVAEVRNSDAERMTDEQSDLEKYEPSTTQAPQNFTSTKDKLKTHLRTILDDLIELQKESGVHKGGEIRIADALPCIYNILNGDVEMNNSIVQEKTLDPYKAISNTFDELRAELKASKQKQTRRMDIKDFKDFLKNTPKSAYVWERVVKNVDDHNKKTARRNIEIRTAVSFEQLKKKMDAIQMSSGSNTYKTFSKIAEVPAAEHLMLLRSLYAEIHRHYNVLKDMKASLETIEKLPADKREEIFEFVENSGISVTLDKKVLESFEKAKKDKKAMPNIIPSEKKSAKIVAKPKEVPEINVKQRAQDTNGYDKNMKLTRDEVLNQLIKNRVTLYMKMRQNKGGDYNNDRNYNIAKNIMMNLDIGDYRLARQLYKIFVTNKIDKSVNTVNDKREKIEKIPVPAPATVVPEQIKEVSQLRRQSILDKQPLIQFDDSGSFTNHILTARRDQMVRNLLNSKNFRLM